MSDKVAVCLRGSLPGGASLSYAGQDRPKKNVFLMQTIFKQEQFNMIYLATIISASIYDGDFTLVLWNCVVSATDPEYGFLYVVVLNVLHLCSFTL